MTRLLVGALAAALNVPIVAFAPAPAAPVVGPPWISIEYPVNPYDAATRDAFLVVHAFHHGSPMAFPVSGTAEGLVNGQRRSINLEFQKAARTGEYALRKQWPNEGTWTLVIGVMQGPEDRVTALVDLSSDGQVARVSVPTRQERGWGVPAKVAIADIEAGLRARAGK
jgi:hypothetical protein